MDKQYLINKINVGFPYKVIVSFIVFCFSILPSTAAYLPLNVQEIDGSPSISDVKKIVVNGATLENNNNGQITLSFINATTLNGFTASQFLRSDTDESFTSGTFTFESGTSVVVDGSFQASSGVFSDSINGSSLILNGNTISIGALTQGSLLFASQANEVTALSKGNDNYVLTVNGNTISWQESVAGVDNLGDHIATQTFDLNGQNLINGADATFTGTLQAPTINGTTTVISQLFNGGKFNGNEANITNTVTAGAFTTTGDTNTAKLIATANVNGTDATFTGNISVGKTLVYDEEVNNGTSTSSKDIDWTAGNRQTITLGVPTTTLTFTNPASTANLILRIVQDVNGSRVITWPASIKWPSATAPTLSTTASSEDIVTCYYSGTAYYCNASLDFAVVP
jgi:hypothetical protein